MSEFILTLDCPDRPGIVHAVTSFLMRHNGNIMESQQFGDQRQHRFFMRIQFEVTGQVTPRSCAPSSRRPPRSSRWSTSCGRRARRTGR